MKSLILLLFSWALVASPVSADQLDPDLLGCLDTKICHISAGGYWEQRENYGTCRVIVKNLGWEHARSYVYLQWLKADDENKKLIEFKTIPIREFNTDNWRNVLTIEYKNETFSIYYVLRGQNKIRNTTIKPELPGEYKVTL